VVRGGRCAQPQVDPRSSPHPAHKSSPLTRGSQGGGQIRAWGGPCRPEPVAAAESTWSPPPPHTHTHLSPDAPPLTPNPHRGRPNLPLVGCTTTWKRRGRKGGEGWRGKRGKGCGRGGCATPSLAAATDGGVVAATVETARGERVGGVGWVRPRVALGRTTRGPAVFFECSLANVMKGSKVLL
jgi:hypothetical protein